MQCIDQPSNQVHSVFSTPYEYDTLPYDNSFRYLTLQPGMGNEPLKCSLRTAPLPQISFEAISYAWGKDLKNREISCSGGSIKITENLHNVLQSLRLPNAPRRLWADGICINQDDLKEKGHQVAIMGQIYRSAKQVLIYVGPDEGGHGPQLCSLLDDVVEMIECTCRHLLMSKTSAFPFPAPNDSLLSDSRWKSLCFLLEKEWFKRGWVVREAAFANIGKVIWGSSEFLWQDLMHVHTWLANRAWRTFNANGIRNWSIRLHTSLYTRQHRQLVDMLHVYDSMSAHNMLQNLNFARYLHVSDPRDRIYAFMELSDHGSEGITITPDYNLPFLDVYRQFAMDYTKYTKSPQVLDYICHPIGAVDLAVASWVPRWDVSIRSLPSKLWRKSQLCPRDDAVGMPTFIGETTFKVRGVVLDRVKYTSVSMDRWITPQILSKIWEDVKFHMDESPYGPTRILDAFLDTLCLGKFQGQWDTWRSARAAFVKHARLSCGPHGREDSLQEDTASGEEEKMDLYLDNVQADVAGFKFIVTERGYFGLAPDITQQSDLCGIVFGCLTPCILRPTAQEQSYLFLGGATLTGKETNRIRCEEVFSNILGEESSKDWVEWDVEEQDIYLV